MKAENSIHPQPRVHYVPAEIRQPYNPVTVNLIGAGGTGSQVLTALARINHALIALGHPGLFVRVFDDDKVEDANIGRQLFFESEVGQYKAAALINRTNRGFGTNWKAHLQKFNKKLNGLNGEAFATLTISCVDSVTARFEIANILTKLSKAYNGRSSPLYWMDLGNGRHTGQVILSTLAAIKQPQINEVNTQDTLPLVTDEFKELLLADAVTNDTPSCSLAEALTKQDLFINPTLAYWGVSLLWQLFRQEYLINRGSFINLATLTAQPIPVGKDYAHDTI